MAFHPVTDRPIHVDFLRIGEHSTVTVAVPIVFTDEDDAPGIKRGNGVLNITRHEIELVVDAADIPSEITISLEGHGDRRFDPHQRRDAAQGRDAGDRRPRLRDRHDRAADRPDRAADEALDAEVAEAQAAEAPPRLLPTPPKRLATRIRPRADPLTVPTFRGQVAATPPAPSSFMETEILPSGGWGGASPPGRVARGTAPPPAPPLKGRGE